MYRTGHYGAALLVYAPLGGGLLVAGFEAAAILGGAGVLAVARLPDYDLRVPFLSHRGPTHTLAFALLVALAAGAGTLAAASAAGRGTASALWAGGLGFAVGLLGVGSHLLADALTPAGIKPLWPLSSRQYSLGVARADSTIANYGLLALGVGVSVTALLAI